MSDKAHTISGNDQCAPDADVRTSEQGYANRKNEDSEISDLYLVDWDGPEDLSNPKNWPFHRRWLATGLVSLVTFMTPIVSSMIAPAEISIAKDLNITGGQLQSQLIFSIFLLAFAIAPFVLAPLSEIFGRMIVLQVSNIWFLVFNLACGFAHNESQMLAFRFLAGLGASAPQTIGGGVLSDLWKPEQRGLAVSIYTLAPLLGPALGPLMGAWITERTTWRWSFWAITIFGVSVQVLLFFTLTETYAPTILRWKAERLRRETGNEKFHTKYELKDRGIGAVMRRASLRVVILLTTQPIVIFLATFMALAYGIIYIMLATFPLLWREYYGESTGIGGLNYISIMIGSVTGMQIGARLIDVIFRRLKRKSINQEAIPEFRVPLMFVSTFLLAAGLLIYGWSAQARLHWIVPNVGAAIFAMGVSINMACLQTYTIDAYPVYAASAIGATAVARALTGFTFPLFAPSMYERLGWGWGNSALALLVLIIGYPGATILWLFGGRLRAASPYAANS